MMDDGLRLISGIGMAGFILGMVTFYLLLKYRVTIPTRQADHLILELPFLGRIQDAFPAQVQRALC